MRCLRFYLTASLIAWVLTAAAQLPQDLKITNFDGSTGFYSRVVTSVLKDRKGFLWLGTSDGLYRYDGYTFRNFRKQADDTNSLSDNYVTQLALGRDNKIWMGLLNGGLSSYDPATGKISNYPVVYKGSPVAGAVTMVLVDHANEVWLGVKQKGFWHLDAAKRSYTPYDVVGMHDPIVPKDRSQAFNTVSTALESKPGILWLGTYNGLYRFTAATRKLEAIRNSSVQQPAFRDDDFISIAADGDLLWLGAWAGGLTRYNTVTGEWKNYKINLAETKKYTTNIISGIRVRSADELWITSNDKGLGIFNKRTGQFSFYSEGPARRNDIPSSLCYEVETDRKDLWLIHEWGLSRIQPRENKFVFTPAPVTRSDNQQFYYVRDMVEDVENIYLATTLADGLHVINKKTGRNQQFAVQVMKGEEPFLAVYRLFIDSKGAVWVVSRDYIYRFDKRAGKLVPALQPPLHPIQNGSNQFNNITEDREGNLWITSARNGVFRYDQQAQKFRHFFQDTTGNSRIASGILAAVTVDKSGRVWIGGPEGCLAYFDKRLDRFVDISPAIPKSFGSGANHVHWLLADKKNNLWIGADEGLVQLNIDGSPTVRQVFTAQEGLRGDIANSIIEDENGRVWCTTPAALCMIEPSTRRVSSIALQNDVIRGITNRVYLALAGGKVQVLTYGGYYSFDPLLFHEVEQNVPLTITGFRVRDKDYYYEADIADKGRIELGPYENLFSFEFAVLDFKQSDDHRYAYMLEGFDQNWVNTGNRRYASYTNIPGGNYTFRVKALNVYGDSKSTEIRIPIYVATPFYYTWWFILLLAMMVAGGLYLFYRFRLKKQAEILKLHAMAQALEKEKTHVQYENLKQHLNPHFLFNSLTSLGSLIRADQKMAGEFLDGMSRIYRYILRSKDNATVPLKQELEFIQNFIRLQKTRFNKGLEVIIGVNGEDMHHQIVPVTLQNLIENAIKHNIVDEDSPLAVSIYVENGYLLVRNNLQRKKFVETSNRQGLDNLKSLYRYLSPHPMQIEETAQYFTVKIPLL